MDARALTQALARRREAVPAETDAFRWLDGELPGLAVDLFGEVAVLSLYREATDDELRRLAEALAGAAALRAVYLKRRPREARRSVEREGAVAPLEPLWGERVPALTVVEQGLRFEVRPDNGLSVGLYLDARDARAWVRREAAGARVLNLFAYTCGFGVAARRGGARRVANVDASRKVLDWGEANLSLNGVVPDRYDFIAGDALDWLGRLAKKEERFELVILDPPGFSTTKRSRFSAATDYHRLVAAAAPVLSWGGRLLCLCNVEAMSMQELEAQVLRGAAGRQVRFTARFGASPLDFRQPSGLKCLVADFPGDGSG